jgi:alkyl sulfatase BDS1-like metallo-beta-lactamase superfamily hydrolase
VKYLFIAVLLPSILFAAESKEPTAITEQKNTAALKQLDFANKDDFADAARGFIGTDKDLVIKGREGTIVWDLRQYNFIKGEQAPSAVNPSLWRQANLNMNNGLFKVSDKIYQIRGYDISNMDIIEGNTGIIIIDPLISKETAKAALELYFKHRPKKPVRAVIYTHSHVDHYGGVKGVVDEEMVKAGKIKIYAPKDFLKEAVSENIYAGNAMSRRAMYQYGPLLPRNERGQIDAGLGKTTSLGEITLIPPTDTIKKTGETKKIDGVEMIFQMAPNTEAPAEMIIYFPQFKALCIAEDANHTMHNLYTLRGAEVRDATSWWKTLNQTIELFGEKTEVVFGQHQWPTWDNTRIISFLESQRNLYKYINDQTLRLLNQGYTMTEIANMLSLPPSLASKWYNRGYYGSLSHNTKAVYQRYLGWYDSNPSHLNPIMPAESSKKYVEYMGGAMAIIKKATEDFQKGEYRWVAEVMNHVVFADPTNIAARSLEADALEQLGYAEENPTWRNEYLMGAYELRNGVKKRGLNTVSADSIRAMTLEMYFDYLGLCLDANKAHDKKITINLHIIDAKEDYLLKLEDSVLIYTANKKIPQADADISLCRATLDAINLKQTTLAKEIENKNVKVKGNKYKLEELFDLFVSFNPDFNIMTPS